MRMRAHVQAVAALELRRAEMIEEHERPDRAAAHMRQRPAHGESIEVDRTRDNHGFERVTGVAVAGRRVFPREKAHEFSSFAARRAISGAFLVCWERLAESQNLAAICPASRVCRAAMRQSRRS